MNLQTAYDEAINHLDGKQDPDRVTFIKQWDETGRLKGWIINVEWGTHQVTLDTTPHYTRVIGNLSVVPDYVPGKHQKV